jgi:hypothetical protein
VSVEVISAVFTGLTGLLAAVAAVLANRSRRVGEDSRAIKRQYRLLQRKLLAALEHIFALEHELAARGIPRPERPEILEQDDDDGPAPTPARANAPA